MEVAQSFANNFWGADDVGYNTLIQRMHDAKLTCEEILHFYRERQSIEADYARRMSALAKKGLGSRETGSLKHSLDVIRTTTEAMARSHETTSRQLGEQLAGPLEAFASSMRERRKTSEDTMLKITKAKTSQNSAADKARQRYESECNKVSGYKAQQNLLVGRELDKNNVKLDKSRFTAEAMEREYQSALRVLSETIENWNQQWKVACDRFQDLEEERISFLKSNLWAYANCVSTVCVADDEGCENVRMALESCETHKDIDKFVESQGTGSKIIDPPAFTNYLGGFSRDSPQAGYKLANYARTGEDEPAVDEQDTCFGSKVSHGGNSLTDPRLSVESNSALHLHPDDHYGSSGSPYHNSTSPSSSVYSNNTSISANSLYRDSEKQFGSQFSDSQSPFPTKKVEKRRSWATPFKRQSSPDLSKVWKPHSEEGAPVGRAPHQTEQEQRHAVERNESVPTTSQDPLLAAMERLKTPPLGSGTGTSNNSRPVSMPGLSAIKKQAHNTASKASPYGNGRTSFIANEGNETPQDGSRSPVRRNVGAGFDNRSAPIEHRRDTQTQDYNTDNSAYKRQAASRPRSKSFVDLQAQRSKHDLPTRTSDNRPVIRYARAQYDYRAAIPEEVSFRKGDILLIVTMQQDGWWDAEVLGKRRFGLAPSNFLGSI